MYTMTESERNVFAELAKIKSAPVPLIVDQEDAAISDDADGQLAVDVYQDSDAFVVQTTVAGVLPDDLDVHITNESITIRGKRERPDLIQESDYLYQECFWGKFSRAIILPQEVDPERSTATLKDGVLTVKMPKLNRSKVRKVKIKTD